MAKNILKEVKCDNLIRLDVNFKIEESSLDSWIGRTAHIQVIECVPFMEMMIHRYKEVFCE